MGAFQPQCKIITTIIIIVTIIEIVTIVEIRSNRTPLLPVVSYASQHTFFQKYNQ